MPFPSHSFLLGGRFIRWTKALTGFAFVLALAHGGTGSVVACGLSLTLPPTPFASSGDYRFAHWEEWGKIKPDPKAESEIPIYVGWTPIAEWQQNSPVLGEGWQLSLFESTLVPENETTYIWRQPFGRTRHLKKDPKNPGLFTSTGWLVEVRGTGLNQVATCKSSCGDWQLTYKAGRLAQLKSKEVTFDFSYEKNGTRQITVNGKTVASLKREFDAATTLPYWRLGFLSEKGWRNAILKLGTRIVLIQVDKKPDQRRNTATLTSVKFDNEPERNYTFTADTLKVAGSFFQWDSKTTNLLEDSGTKFAFRKIRNINCLQKTDPNGKTTLNGRDLARGVEIATTDEGLTLIREYIPGTPVALSYLRKLFQVDHSGHEKLMKQIWYDENLNIMRMLDKEGASGKLYAFAKGETTCSDERSGNIIWKKQFDEQKRMISFINNGRKYFFDYSKDKSVTIIRENERKERTERTLPLNELQKLQFFNIQP